MKLYYYACSRPSSMAAAQALLYRPAQRGLAGPNRPSFLRSRLGLRIRPVDYRPILTVYHDQTAVR